MIGRSRTAVAEHTMTGCVLAMLLTGLVAASFAGADGWSAQVPDSGPYPIREVPIPSPESLGPDVGAADPSLPSAPPDDPQVGDSWLWWLFYHDPMPPHFSQELCTVRGKTDHGYVIVEESQWEVNIFQSDVDLILERWENSSLGIHPDMGIYGIDSLYFGKPPDELDDDPSVYLVWFDIGTFGDGFFFWFDEYLDGTYQGYRSNECEAVYLNSGGSYGPSSDYMISVAAHELEHMIHWKYDDDESPWVDEGMAELAMWFYGRPDDISSFNNNADNSLVQWDGLWADYIKTYLWSLYYYERYGGGDAVRQVVHHSLNSINGYEAVLDSFGFEENFADVFADWAVANFLDNTTLADGRFGYVGDDLPAFSVMAAYSSYPVPDQSSNVNHWGTDYYRFENLETVSSLELNFDGSDDNLFAVWGLALHGDGATSVHRAQLDSGTQSGVLDVAGLGQPEDEVILVVAGTSSTGATGYTFNAQAGQLEGEDDGAGGTPGQAALLLHARPNPSNGDVTLRISCPGAPDGMLTVTIHDAAGRLIRSLSTASAANVALTWDGSGSAGGRAAPGVYFARAQMGSQSSHRELIILR